MNLRIYLIAAALFVALSAGVAWHIYEKGVSAGKANAKIEQEKYVKKVKVKDVQVDKDTPFSAGRDAQLKWLYRYTVRQ